MTSLFLLFFFCGLMLMGLRRPFIWVLAYIYVDIVSPQRISPDIIGLIPVSLIAFVAAFGGWLMFDNKKGLRFTGRQGLIVALLVYCGVATLVADYPEAAAEKWAWVWKALLFAAFLPLALRTRLRIEAAILVTILSLGAIVISGGIKTVFGGGGYDTLRLLVDNNAGLFEGSTISTVAIAAIPLIIWLAQRGTVYPPSRGVKIFAGALIIACCLIPIGTATRTGLLCIGMLAILMLRTVRHRMLYIGFIGLVGFASVPFLSDSYTERMSTIEAPASDQSASSRLAVWRWTLDYVGKHPLGGGFDAYRGNSFTYTMPMTVREGNSTTTKYIEVTDRARAYHSSYFEMLGEHGWPGLLLWLALNLSGVIQMERLARRWKKRVAEAPDDPALAWQAPLATALQQAQLVYLVGSFFVGIAFQPVIYLLIGFQIALSNHVNAYESTHPQEPAKRRSKSSGEEGRGEAGKGASSSPAMP